MTIHDQNHPAHFIIKEYPKWANIFNNLFETVNKGNKIKIPQSHNEDPENSSQMLAILQRFTVHVSSVPEHKQDTDVIFQFLSHLE